MSYVLKGEIEHYDSQLKGWKTLAAGDVQVIRAGDGIVHAEKLLPDSAIFQIWFDPDLEKSLVRPASYDDYAAATCPVRTVGGLTTKMILGEGGPVAMETPGVTIEDQVYQPGSYTLPCDPSRVLVTCVIDGELSVNGHPAPLGSSVRVKGEGPLTITATAPARWLVIGAPANPGYRTYASMHRLGE
jgi:redox-sensitive bicupin YhaK (pirin superfamily)